MSRKLLHVVAAVFGIASLSSAEWIYSLSRDRNHLLRVDDVLLSASEVSGDFRYEYEGSPSYHLVGEKFTHLQYGYAEGWEPILVGVVHAGCDTEEFAGSDILFAFYPQRRQRRLEIVSVGIDESIRYLGFARGCRAIVIIENSNQEEISMVKVFERKVRNGMTSFPLKEERPLYEL